MLKPSVPIEKRLYKRDEKSSWGRRVLLSIVPRIAAPCSAEWILGNLFKRLLGALWKYSSRKSMCGFYGLSGEGAPSMGQAHSTLPEIAANRHTEGELVSLGTGNLACITSNPWVSEVKAHHQLLVFGPEPPWPGPEAFSFDSSLPHRSSWYWRRQTYTHHLHTINTQRPLCSIEYQGIKGDCQQARWPEFDSQNPSGRGRDQVLQFVFWPPHKGYGTCKAPTR